MDARAGASGVRVLSVTDHDTVAALQPAAVACARAGIETSYRDVWGTRHDVPEASLRALLAEFGDGADGWRRIEPPEAQRPCYLPPDLKDWLPEDDLAQGRDVIGHVTPPGVGVPRSLGSTPPDIVPRI